MSKDFELLPHTADIKIRAYGKTLEELFRNAMHGMFESCAPLRQSSTEHRKRSIAVQSAELKLLLVDFLSDCLYLSDVHDEVYDTAVFDILTETEVRGTVYGTPIAGFDHVEIKAVTYHDLSIEQVDGMWQATFVCDI